MSTDTPAAPTPKKPRRTRTKKIASPPAIRLIEGVYTLPELEAIVATLKSIVV